MIKILIQLYFRFSKMTLKKWIELEDIKENIAEVRGDFVTSIYKYLNRAVGFRWLWGKLKWQTTIEIMGLINALSAPTNKSLPLLTSSKSPHKNNESIAWEYEGRTLYYWGHLLAKEYGWNLDYIKNMDIDTVLALIQEILISEQLAKEFQWGLSEMAYSYNADTKKSRFIPLDRPNWMLPSIDESKIKPVKIRASHVPMGLVITSDDIKAKEIKSG